MSFSSVALALIQINAIIVIVILIREERDPSTTLAWAFALLLMPGFGLIAYLLFGTDHRRRARHDRARREAQLKAAATLDPLYVRFNNDAATRLAEEHPLAVRLSSAIERQCGTRLLPCEHLELITDGETAFERLIDDIRGARESINLQFFIWGNDALTARVCGELAAKVAGGVEVRVLYDSMGSLRRGKAQLRELARSGAAVVTDRPHPAWMNYRDHRKIVVVDGKIGYTGGMNMAQEYVDGGRRFAHWRDTQCRFTGPLVAELQRMFAARWYRLTNEDLFIERHFPELAIHGERPVWGQLAFSGPDSEWQAVRNTFLLCILGAERSLRVCSPYFVPDEAIGEALNVQSLTGVDVRFMMTGVPDKYGVWYAAFSYIDELIEAGGRMFQYMDGFFHPKTLTVDGRIAVIGTANFDIRSFALHDELSLFFYDAATARELDDHFRRDEAHCREIDGAFYARLHPLARTRNAFMRLWSRLL
ncbi:MAG: cardiolipin synthase [Coriobacteriia bacterium]